MSLYVMVLGDGETYTNLHNCAIMEIPDHVEDDEMDWYVKHGPESRILTTFSSPQQTKQHLLGDNAVM